VKVTAAMAKNIHMTDACFAKIGGHIKECITTWLQGNKRKMMEGGAVGESKKVRTERPGLDSSKGGPCSRSDSGRGGRVGRAWERC
jgi:hypothetical protein